MRKVSIVYSRTINNKILQEKNWREVIKYCVNSKSTFNIRKKHKRKRGNVNIYLVIRRSLIPVKERVSFMITNREIAAVH